MKKLLRTLVCLLLAVSCVCTIPLQARAASRNHVPDICNVLGVDGEYVGTEVAVSGISYDYYAYMPCMTLEEIADAISRYALAMGKLGYQETLMEIETDFGLGWHVYDNGRDIVELIFDAAEEVDYSNLKGEGDILWLLILAVPTHMDFTLGEGVEGVTDDGQDICKLCEGHGKCTFCHGQGSYRMNRQTYTCGSCQGTGLCSICQGYGVYRD